MRVAREGSPKTGGCCTYSLREMSTWSIASSFPTDALHERRKTSFSDGNQAAVPDRVSSAILFTWLTAAVPPSVFVKRSSFSSSSLATGVSALSI